MTSIFSQDRSILKNFVAWIIRRHHASVSSNYELLTRSEALQANQAHGGWLDLETAIRQQSAYKTLIADMKRGKIRSDLIAAVQAVKQTQISSPSILEVGCGGGYYSEVFEELLGGPFKYMGVDYSAAMIGQARSSYPEREFAVADACALGYPDDSFDIVFNCVSLMHVLSYEQAIKEGRRVANRYCLYHSVPVFDNRETTYLSKQAYGAPVVEVIFNKDELLALFAANGLGLVNTWPSIEYDVYAATGTHSRCETYLLELQ